MLRDWEFEQLCFTDFSFFFFVGIIFCVVLCYGIFLILSSFVIFFLCLGEFLLLTPQKKRPPGGGGGGGFGSKQHEQ